MNKYLLQLVKLEPVSGLELEAGYPDHTIIGEQHYKQSITAIQLTEAKVEALLALVENVEMMAQRALVGDEPEA